MEGDINLSTAVPFNPGTLDKLARMVALAKALEDFAAQLDAGQEG